MKTTLILIGLAMAGSAFAEEAATQKLLNAVTVCPAAANPLRALKAFGGNAFANARFETGDEAVVADVVYDPRLLNPLLMGPLRMVGKIRVELRYPAPGYGLECAVARY